MKRYSQNILKWWRKLPKVTQIIAKVLVMCIGLLIPIIIGQSYYYRISTQMLVYMMFGLSLNIMVGYAGQISLGHAAFAAIGAYAVTYFEIHYGMNFFLASFLGGMIAVIFSLLLGLPTLKLTDCYLMIATMGFAEIVKLLALNWKSVTNGSLGIKNIPAPEAFGIQLTNANGGLYIMTILFFVITVFICWAIKHSKFGRALGAIRNDELAASLMGINNYSSKVIAFAISCFIAGYAGSIYATLSRYLDPKTFTNDMSTLILCIVVLGGSGTIFGVILGAIILVAVPELLRSFSDYRFLMYGIVLILMMRFRPQGIIDNKSRAPFALPKGVIINRNRVEG